VTKIVYERLRVNEKKQIKAGSMETGQLPASNSGCSMDPESIPAGGEIIPNTFYNRCLLRTEES
jgi:hypothetical protein